MATTAQSFLVKNDNDSTLKTAVEIIGAALAVYFGLNLLKGQIAKDQATAAVANQTSTAERNPNSAAALAQRLVNSLHTGWNENTDEEEVFAVLNTIGTSEFLDDVATSYRLQTKGRILVNDLQNGLDPSSFYTPDWNRAKARIQLIRKYHRKPVKK